MSANALTYDDWRGAVIEDAHRPHDGIEDRCTDEVHPAARVMIHEWLSDLRAAACDGDAAEAHRIADLCEAKIADELAWHRGLVGRFRHDLEQVGYPTPKSGCDPFKYCRGGARP
jgi:hypothetical protein